MVSANVGFMFGRLNNGWSHMAVYGFAYPLLVLVIYIRLFKLINLDSNSSLKCRYAWNG